MRLYEMAKLLKGVVSNGEILCPGPNHSSEDKSLSIRLDEQNPNEFLVHSFAGDDPIECKDYVRRTLGLPEFVPQSKHSNKKDKITMSQQHSVAPIDIKTNGDIDELVTKIEKSRSVPLNNYWSYRTTDGLGVSFVVARWEDKEFRPYIYVDDKWIPKSHPTPRPIYNLDLITKNPDKSILVVEGEKCADAASDLFDRIVTTWSGGAGAVEKSDWTPLARRKVCLWPDNDKPGKIAMNKLAAMLTSLGAMVSIINLDVLANRHPDEHGLPDKFDVADAIEEKWDISDLRQAIKEASEPQISKPQIEPTHNQIVTVSADQIKQRAVDWVWPGYIPKANLIIVAGKPGTGKTTVALSLAAIISSGGAFPDGKNARTGNVLIWSGEDGVEDTIVPRLTAAGADLKKVYIIQGKTITGKNSKPFDPSTDMVNLIDAAKQIGNVSLLILDSIVSVVQGDSHRNAETRRSLQCVIDFAQAINCAVIGITHLTKGTAGQDPLERVTGSLAFGALARIVLLTAKSPHTDGKNDERLLTRAKSNLGPEGDGFYFEIEKASFNLEGTTSSDTTGISTSKVRWTKPVKGSASDLLKGMEHSNTVNAPGKPNKVEVFLFEVLHKGPVLAAKVKRMAVERKISLKALDKAASNIEVIKKKIGFTEGWAWELPSEDSDFSFEKPELDQISDHDELIDSSASSEPSQPSPPLVQSEIIYNINNSKEDREYIKENNICNYILYETHEDYQEYEEYE